MGVPKFFRWISERYPKINQPIHAPPNPETQKEYFPNYKRIVNHDSDSHEQNHKFKQDNKVYMQKNSIIPEFDRLYLDMNGIIHCSSHNNASDDNATIDPDTHIEDLNLELGSSSSLDAPSNGTVHISEEEIFRNVCYYVDRVVTDIVKPKELVYMAIDGVAPRAKMNQQRSRRYRSGKEREIEKTFYAAHLLKQRKEQEMRMGLQKGMGENNDGYDDGYDDYNFVNMDGEFEYNRDNVNRSMRHEQKSYVDDYSAMNTGDVKEVEPGRFTGKFETSGTNISSVDDTDNLSSTVDGVNSKELFNQDYDEFIKSIEKFDNNDRAVSNLFHSNAITPGTPFFERCTEHLQHFIKRKLHTDPRWAHLTIIFSGPRTPGEGEHKIMDFIRSQKQRKDYNPNTRHCLFGQDGDLIMLGLATHEPHFALLREEVIFDQNRKKTNLQMYKAAQQKLLDNETPSNSTESMIADGNVSSESVSASIDSYIHNSNFELLHMSILRDYLAYEFETKEVVPKSPFELEATIDDFVFMTFFVGNDFLPHMPAIDIADEAFDLLFYTYKRNRWKWLKGGKGKQNQVHPYLTNAGEIVSGKRLEKFLTYLGQHEDPYYDNKQRKLADDNQRVRKADKRAGRDSSVPPDEILAAREEWERTNYKEMLMSIASLPQNTPSSNNSFTPVATQSNIFHEWETTRKKNFEFKPEFTDEEELDEGFVSRMGTLFRNSLSNSGDEAVEINDHDSKEVTNSNEDFEDHVEDLKGRYYYDKFQFSPLDAEKHIALRKAYIEGLVWNLEYYYKGCASWDWFYPYHYGPMLSDLKDINNLLKQISFKMDESRPLQPFEQLMANLPPSSAELLPRPYQWLMKSLKSPIVDFYPESFTVDMNGKRWPWEAVVLLPFIDSERLVSASRTYVTNDLLSDDERSRNQVEDALVYSRDSNSNIELPALKSGRCFEALSICNVRQEDYRSSKWSDSNSEAFATFRPQLLPGTTIPYPGFPSLKDAPVLALKKRKLGINIFGMRSRYRTAVLEMNSDIPMIASATTIADKFIGTTVYFRYPFLQEGFVTAVSDSEMTVRGKDSPRHWSEKEAQSWQLKNSAIRRLYITGDGLTGSGGWDIPESSVTLSVRPLKEIQTLPDGRIAKVYARLEVEVPFIAALWSPSRPDPRFSNIPARLEKNPYRFGSEPSMPSIGIAKLTQNKMKDKMNIFPCDKNILKQNVSNKNILPPANAQYISKRIIGGRKGFCTQTMQNCEGRQYQVNTTTTRQKYPRRLRMGRHTSVGVTAAAMLFGMFSRGIHGETTCPLLPTMNKMENSFVSRGGAFHSNDSILDLDLHESRDEENLQVTPPLEFAHGTTTISFTFNGGIVAAVDSRASIGNFVGSKTTQKVLPITSKILGTMAGGAADCSFWIRKLQAESRFYELSEERQISVARVSRLLADYLYQNRSLELSVGTMIMGFDEDGPSIYYVDNSGTRLKGDLFAVGSGSTFALGILDTERRENMNEKEAIALGIKAIRHATFRDAFSGGFIAVYVIKGNGWEKVFSEDLAMTDK